jgi:hypothetical protein
MGSIPTSFEGGNIDSMGVKHEFLMKTAASAPMPGQSSARITQRIAGYEISLLRAYYCYAFRYETAPEEAAS